MNQPLPPRTDSAGTRWQYHPRRGAHSEVTSWGVLFDLLQTSSLLRSHFATGKVVFGLDVPLRDFTRDKSKKLDLVIARPGTADPPTRARSLSSLIGEWSIVLSEQQRAKLVDYRFVRTGPIGQVHLAVEAKAAMTEFGKARPRLFDELNSSHQIVHGASNKALAVGVVMINASDRFVSPLRNPGHSYNDANVATHHKQPRQARLTVDHVKTLPKRGGNQDHGYDGLAIFLVHVANDGSTVRLETSPPAPDSESVYNYDRMIARIAGEYDATFSKV